MGVQIHFHNLRVQNRARSAAATMAAPDFSGQGARSAGYEDEFEIGRECRARTDDIHLVRVALYQLS